MFVRIINGEIEGVTASIKAQIIVKLLIAENYSKYQRPLLVLFLILLLNENYFNQHSRTNQIYLEW